MDERYCKCSHLADDHNPLSLACYRCDCSRWRADLDRLQSKIMQEYLKERLAEPITPMTASDFESQ
jgi:hypothetical protein